MAISTITVPRSRSTDSIRARLRVTVTAVVDIEGECNKTREYGYADSGALFMTKYWHG